LNDIEVDISSAEVQFSDEMQRLKASIDGSSFSSSSGSGGADPEALKVLKTENAKLRGLLTEAQAELSKAQTSPSSLFPSQSSSMSTEMEELKSQLRQSEALIKQKDEQLQAAQGEIKNLLSAAAANDEEKLLLDEISRVKTEVASLEKQLSDNIKEAEAKLKSKTLELTQIADKRVNEAETRLEAEKEEMMEAMSQEVEVSA